MDGLNHGYTHGNSCNFYPEFVVLVVDTVGHCHYIVYLDEIPGNGIAGKGMVPVPLTSSGLASRVDHGSLHNSPWPADAHSGMAPVFQHGIDNKSRRLNSFLTA